MGKKSLSINAGLNAIRSVLNMFFPLITYPYTTAVLSVDELGKYNFSLSIINYFALIAGLGVSSYAIREGARIRDDKKALSLFANQMLEINLISMCVAYVLLFAVLGVSVTLVPYRNLIVFLSIQMLFTTIGVEWLYAIFEEYQYITIRSIVFKVISIALLFIMVKNEGDVFRYAAVVMFATTGSNILDAFFARKYFKFSLVPLQTLKQHIRPIMVLFASNIAVMVYVYSDTTMLGLMADDYTVGIYAVSSKVYSMMKSVLSAVLVVSIPRLANLYGMGEVTKFKSVVQNITDTIALLVIPSVVGLILQSQNIILFISNEKYLQAIPSLVILSIGLISCMYGWIYNQCVLLPAQKENVILTATIISAFVNVGLNVILIGNWREIATAFTTLIAESIMLVICRHESLKICRIKIFNKNLITVCIGTIAVVCICKIVSLWKLQSSIELFASVVLSGIGYLVVLLVLKNELIMKAVGKLDDKLNVHNR
ncbi:flippase [Clostridium sp. AM30-24]|nr:flippase [Clostridium sp. AM30-24]RHT43351.1 flippase [Clostridium sp. AM30-24]